MTPRKFSTLIFATALAACSTDVYEKGEGDYSLMQAQMVMAHTNTDKRVDRFVTDDNEQLAVLTPFTASWLQTPDTTYRALFYFSKTEQGAKVQGLSYVGVISPKKITDLKADPVGFESSWMASNGRFLNLCLQLMSGTADQAEEPHTLGCHIDTLMHNADSTRTLHLQLYHDQAGVPQYYSQRTFLSIPTSDIDADSICLNINTYKGIVRKSFRLQSTP